MNRMVLLAFDVLEDLLPRGLGAVLLFLFTFAFFSLIRNLRLGLASANWPNVLGVVIESSVSRSWDDGVWRFGAQVRFTYEVDGSLYQGSEWSYRPIGPTREDAETIVAEYSRGTEIPVYYDPTKPSQAVLRPGADVGLFVSLIVFSILVACIGAVLLVKGDLAPIVIIPW